jgi:hypothetical protein
LMPIEAKWCGALSCCLSRSSIVICAGHSLTLLPLSMPLLLLQVLLNPVQEDVSELDGVFT